MPVDPFALVQSAQQDRLLNEQALANVKAADDAARTSSAQQAEIPPPRDPNAPCPCDGPLTDAQKALHNLGLGMKNPVGDASRGCSARLAGSLLKVTQLISGTGDPTGKLATLYSSVQGMANSVDMLSAEADRLSDPANLMTTLGTMNLYGKIGCALGIEGLDISVAISATNGGGINAIAGAVKAQVDLDSLLDNALQGANLVDGANALSAGIDGAINSLGGAGGNITNVINAGQLAMAEAMAKVTEFAQINFFANLVGDGTDPCNTLAVDVSKNMLSPEFTRYSENALASVKNSTTIGAGFR